MKDEELNQQCQKIDYYYQEFLSEQKDLLHTPIEELLSRFYFAGYEQALKIETKSTKEENIPGYVQRMIVEHKELKEKIQKLQAFINDDEKTKALSETDYNLLNCQVSAMVTYVCVLTARLAREISNGNCTPEEVYS